MINAKSEIYNIDCMEYMKTLPDNAFDLAIVDPPYGLDKKSTQESGVLKNRCINRSNMSEWDIRPTQDYFDELFRVSKNQIIWGGNYFDLKPTRCFVCWNKMQAFENFSQCEMAWTSFDKPAKLFTFSNTGGGADKNKFHPTQKPIELYSYLLKQFAKQGDRILDTHLGSGSSRIAAYKLDFDFVACEINKEYFTKSDERFKTACLGEYKDKTGKVVKQLELF